MFYIFVQIEINHVQAIETVKQVIALWNILFMVQVKDMRDQDLVSDLTMLDTINPVLETFRDCATIAMTNRWPRLHASESVAEPLRLLPNCETTVSVRRFM